MRPFQVGLLAILPLPVHVYSAGFQIQGQSGRALGSAFAGEGASAEDAVAEHRQAGA
jgi:long-subunit fatty acid transport protein